MVFEGLFIDAFNRLLGDYIENLDKTQLQLGIWSGRLTFQNIKLLTNALDDLNLPVHLTYGIIGKLELKIPWKHIYSRPVVIAIEDVYLLIAPKEEKPYDPEEELKSELEAKYEALQKIEEAASKETEPDKPKQDKSFMEKLIVQIVNNLQVKIAKVHLRYEDTTTIGKAFSCGLTLQELSIFTTDENWVKSYQTERSSRIYKFANLNSLSFYYNWTDDLYVHLSEEELVNALKYNIAHKQSLAPQYQYILRPISAIANVRLNKNPENDDPPFEMPQTYLNMEMEHLQLGLTTLQYRDMFMIWDTINRIYVGMPYRKHRPFKTPYANNERIWWKFAITVVLEYIREKHICWSWAHIREHRRLCNLYAQKLKERELQTFSSDLTEEACKLLEQKLDVFNIVLIRNRVRFELNKIKMKRTTDKLGWFRRLLLRLRRKKKTMREELAEKLNAELTPEEKEKLYEAIGYQENAVPLNIPEHFKARTLYFTLVALEIGLYDDNRKRFRKILAISDTPIWTVMLLKFSSLLCSLEQRPSANAFSCQAAIKVMKLTGLDRTKSPPITIIESVVSKEDNLIDVIYEKKPLNRACDQRFILTAHPLQILYDSETINHLYRVFMPPEDLALPELDVAATQAEFKDHSVAVIQQFLEAHEVFDIVINCKPNIIIIPRNGVYEPENSSAIVISLGMFRVTSKLHEKQPHDMSALFDAAKSREVLPLEVVEELYDKYKLTIDGVQILVVTAHEHWAHVLRSGIISEMHILRPTSINATVALCVFNDDPRLAKTKINIVLPHFHVNLTEFRILETFKVLSSTMVDETKVRQTTTSSVSSYLAAPLPKTLKKDIELIKIDRAGSKRSSYEKLKVQYTDYELKFTLKEFIVTLYANFVDVDILSTFSSETSEISIFSRENVHEFTATPVQSQMSMSSDMHQKKRKHKIITLKILQLEVEVTQRTYEFLVTARIGSINITQYNPLNNLEMVSLVDTPRFSRKLKFKKYLLTVSVIMTDKNYPGFAIRHNLTEQLIEINFSTLTLIGHKEYLTSLLALLHSIHRKIYNLIQPAISKLTKIIGEEVEEVAVLITRPHLKHKSASIQHEIIEIHFIANLEQVSMELMCNKRSLVFLNVQQFNAEMILKSAYTKVNLFLRNIIITDPNPLSIHTSILTIVCNNALTYQMITFNSDRKANPHSEDMDIQLEIGCIKIVFLYWFFNSVMSFFYHFAPTQEIPQARAREADVAKSKVLNEAMRIKFFVGLKAPVIVLPVDSQSLKSVVLNLGFITLSNKITQRLVPKDKRSPAFVDEILLEWKDVKLYKCALAEVPTTLRYHHGSIDTIRFSEEMDCASNILEPLSFTMEAKRNLSFTWYHNDPEINISGKFKLVEINLLMEDYRLIMSILHKNLNEGLTEFEEEKLKRNIKYRKASIFSQLEKLYEEDIKAETKAKLKVEKDKTNIYKQRRLNFQLDGVILNLSMATDEELACLNLYSLSIKSKAYTDDVYKFTMFLCNLQIDDRRSDRNSITTKYLCHKNWRKRDLPKTEAQMKATTACKKNDDKHILDFTIIFRDNETFAKLHVSGFDMILSIDFLTPLLTFFTLPIYADNPEPKDVRVNATMPTAKSAIHVDDVTSKLNVSLYMEELNLILTESLEVDDPIAVVIEAHTLLDYRAANRKQQLTGQIDSIQMYMCSFLFERREETKHFILHPCMIKLQSTSNDEFHVHLSIRFTELILHISPATMELIHKLILTFQIQVRGSTYVNRENADYSQLWKPSKFDETEYWFINFVEEHQMETFDASDQLEEENVESEKTEICNVTAESITIKFEDGVGFYTTPLFSIHAKINAIVQDWSSELKVEGSMFLNMDYYNQELADWEPVIELIERTNSQGLKHFIPWELDFIVKMEAQKSKYGKTMDGYKTNIRIYSEKILQLTLSKTGLSLIYLFWEDFSKAIESHGLVKPDVISPCLVRNNTDMNITINFTRGVLTLHDCYISNPKQSAKTTTNRLKQIYLRLKVTLTDKDKFCKLMPDEQVYLQVKDMRVTSEEDQNYKLYLKIGDDENAREIVVPVYKSDKRYFPIYPDSNSWAVITRVHTVFGTARVRVHGIVVVQNHLKAKISIFHEKPSGKDKVLLADVEPDKIYDIPLHAIYAEEKTLYFSLEGYKMSELGFDWNHSLNEISYAFEIRCDPLASFEPFYIYVVREKTKVFFENSNKYKQSSVYYTIHLHPPICLRNALPIELRVSVAGCSVYKHKEKRELEEVVAKHMVQKTEEEIGEKNISPGDLLQITAYKTQSIPTESKSFLVLRLIQYLDKDWSCTTDIYIEDREVAIWTFTSYDSVEKMDLDLYAHFDQSNGSLLITIFSPFWMLNKTGLMLIYKADSDTVEELYHPAEYDGAVLFSFREHCFFDKKSTSIRVDNGDWSEEIPLDVAGSTGSVTCKANNLTYVIGVHNHLTYNALTKNITFIPFFMATNNCEFLIEYQEYSRPADPWIKIEPNSCQPIWPKNPLDHKVMLKVQGQYTVAFDYSEEQCTLLRLKNNIYGGINVYVHATEGGVCIDFSQYNPGDAPGLLINHTSRTVPFYEKDSLTKYTLGPGQKILYTWHDPTGEKLLIFGENSMTCDLHHDGLGELMLHNGPGGFWMCFLDGLQRILLFTEFETVVHKSSSGLTLQHYSQAIDITLRGIGLSVVNDETGLDILYMSIMSSDIVWESRHENKNYYKLVSPAETKEIENLYQEYLDDTGMQNELDVNVLLDNKWPLNFQAMTLKKNNVFYLLQRSYYPGFLMSMNSTQFQTQLHCKIHNFQIDNQLNFCIYPEMLYPTPQRMSVVPNRKIDPFIEFSCVHRYITNSTVWQYKYVNLLIQEFYFKVDFMVLNTIADFFTGSTDDEMTYKLFKEDLLYIKKPLTDLVETRLSVEPKNFYDHLYLGPLKMYVSFSMGSHDNEVVSGLLTTLIHGLGVTLSDVSDAIFLLACFEREYKFYTRNQLTAEIQAHYTALLLKQIYVLVLGLDVLGNPYGLVIGLKRGVEDLFSEPYQGAIQGPAEFVEGLVLGLKSFVGHTVGGTAGAVSRITGAMGKGLALLTFDQEFQKKRRYLIYKRPVSFHDDMRRSGKSLAMGFYDGITGFVKKPLNGAKKTGFQGFVKGFGKGTIGLVTCPAAGIVDFTSVSLLAVKLITTTYKDVRRLRLPRFLHKGKVLMPYSRVYAQGIHILRKLDRGKYSKDTFEHCEELEPNFDYLIATSQRVLFVQKSFLFEYWVLQWSYMWYDINSIASSDINKGSLVFRVNEFNTTQYNLKTISISNKQRRDNLANILEKLRKEA